MTTNTSRRAAVLVSTALLLSLGGPAVAAEYTGTAGNDKISGSSSADRLFGRGGDDTLSGWGAGDYIDGEDGNDTLKGNDGNDDIRGGLGADKEWGGTGGDTMNGGGGHDTMYGGRGVDDMDGGDGNDEVFAKDAEDVGALPDNTGDTVRGGAGDDKIYTRDGERDTVTCGAGTDTAYLDYQDQLTDGSCENAWRAAPASMKDTGKEVAQSARDWALLKEGVTESPLGSNRGPEIDQWAQNSTTPLGSAWCGVFAHEAYLRGGLNLPDSIRSTDWLYDAAVRDQYNFSEVKIANIRPGDLLLMDWPGSGDDDDHIAIVLNSYVPGSSTIPTISGNSSDRVKRNAYSVSQVALAVRVSL